MSKLARTAARLLTGIAVVASSLGAAQPHAVAGGTEISIRIGPRPSATVTPGTVDPVGSVRGVAHGTRVDLDECAVSGFDPAAIGTGRATVTLSGCAGSDTTVVIEHGGGVADRPYVKANMMGRLVALQYWCEWVYIYDIPYWDCYYRSLYA